VSDREREHRERMRVLVNAARDVVMERACDQTTHRHKAAMAALKIARDADWTGDEDRTLRELGEALIASGTRTDTPSEG